MNGTSVPAVVGYMRIVYKIASLVITEKKDFVICSCLDILH